MKAYKGFNNDLTCRGFKFQEGKTYEEEKADLCHTGFHSCEYPLDCFNYYPPAGSVYHAVELEGVSDQRENDTKIVGKKITIGARVDFAGLISAAVQYTIERTHKVDCGHTDENQGAASNTGDQGAASNTGYQGAASSDGANSIAVTVGAESTAAVTSCSSIACALGKGSRAKGTLHAWIVLAERGEWNGHAYPIMSVVAREVDGETIKPDVFYKLANGAVVEA